MFFLNIKNGNYSGRDKAVFRFMEVSFIAVLVILIINSFTNPTCKYCYVLYLLNFFLFIGLLLRKQYSNIAVHFYFIIFICIVVIFDLSGFFIHEISSYLYLLIVLLSLLLLNTPRNYIYSFSTLFIYTLRTFFTYELSSTEKILLVFIAYIGTASIYFVKDWVMQLHKYKISLLQKLHNSSIKILGKVAELKDEGTANHLDRVEIMVEMLCTSLKTEKKYRNYIDDRYIHDIRSAAYLHDIGKIGIPDKILGKKGSLTKKEFEMIKSHTTIGFDILSDAKSEIEGESVYDLALEIARHHHEKWDGNGYPHGLSGEAIPFSARVMAVVDVYDALVSRRPYKVPFPHSKAMEIIIEGSGTHFDPQIVDHFLAVSEEIHMKISRLLI